MNPGAEAPYGDEALRQRGTRFALAALLAGVMCNVSGIGLGAAFLHAEAQAAFSRLSHPPTPLGIFVRHVSMRLVLGALVAWLVVALFARYRRPMHAAVVAALFVWLSAYGLAGLILLELEIYSAKTTVVALAWGLAELCLMSLAVAWICQPRAPRDDSS